MRIAVSNPDNLGDLVVRQPMLAAFLEAGHELLLIVRAHVAPLAAWSVPGASIAICAGDPYATRFHLASAPDDRLIAAVQAFDPDVFVVATYQHTQLEEQLAKCLPRAQVAGFGGELRQNDGSIGVTHVSELQFSIRVQVGRDWPESRKNELLCGAVLGTAVTLASPKLVAQPQFVAIASDRLRREGLADRKFWVVCAGEGSEYTGLKNWPLEKWAQLCTELVKDHGLHLVFVGTPVEHESTQAIRAQMGPSAENTLDMTAFPDGLDMLAGLLALSSGYVGKDTGPMHMAAALGKPVAAVFGGGHWPRFLPAPATGKVVTMQVPCMNCDWVCPYKTSHCVKDVPYAAMRDAVVSLLSGAASGFETVLLPQDEWVARAMALEAAETARNATLALTVERHNFHQWHSDRLSDIEGLRQQIALLETQKSDFELERQGWTDAICQLRDAAVRVAAERLEERRLSQERVETKEQEITRLSVLSIAVTAQMETIRRDHSALRDALSAADALTAQETAELRQRLTDTLATVTELTGENARLARESVERAASLNFANAKLDLLESREQGGIADLRLQLRRTEAELHSVLALVPDLRTELTRSMEDATALQNEINRLQTALRERHTEIEKLRASLQSAETESAAHLAHIAEIESDRAARLAIIESSARQIQQLQDDQRAKQALLDRLSHDIANIEADRAERLAIIESSARHIQDLQDDQRAKQTLIDRLSHDITTIESDRGAKQTLIDRLSHDITAIESDRTAKQTLIDRLSHDVTEIESDRTAKQTLIDRLSHDITAIESDRAAKQTLIEQLSSNLAAIELDHAERLKLIESSARHMQELETDRNAKQAVIDRLSSTLAIVEGDRTDRGRQIETLNHFVHELEAEAAELRMTLLPRLTRLVRRA